MNLQHKKVLSMGPGGWKCQCCGPTQKDRPFYRRRMRKIINRMLTKFLD